MSLFGFVLAGAALLLLGGLLRKKGSVI